MKESLDQHAGHKAGAVDRLTTGGAKLRQRNIKNAREAGPQDTGHPAATPDRNLACFHIPLHGNTLSRSRPIRIDGRACF